ncbi:AadS family aminoglycoside 6-adenylyltransferase [Chitinophaga sp. sic0106]|uniref:AadS family aminoglycoside 6-adenylyltransferase n=1 Tax=Chitinophaga sp. sic0106 TaxID=2854785 RepID=UPI001C48E99B|nr:AadS family aminoglycoside 6-adenylyltransferase [Chitinophaga sp. sic0106]MBV7529868.1 AadS family aminoglycoside 6-adenylyltransferase [Chitinophaga sp. sic0106]
MNTRDLKLEAVTAWAAANTEIRAMLLTSSLVNPYAPVDEFSDLDIELIFTDLPKYISDNSWLQLFGSINATVEEGEEAFEGRHAMKMVLYADHVKIDFKLYSVQHFLEDAAEPQLPEDWDIGYRVILDKDGITNQLLPPSYAPAIIQPPSAAKFAQVINDAWWDMTYVAKCLTRHDIFYAKFMSEDMMRTNYLVPLIEWYIGSQHNWQVSTNKHGRLFPQYLTPECWSAIQATFSGAEIEDNWRALFAYTDVVHQLGTELGERLNFVYPYETERKVRIYLSEVYTKKALR